MSTHSGTTATAIGDDEFVPFILEDYIQNPIALARIRADLTRQQLAERMTLTPGYISKIERQDKVTAKLLQRVHKVLSASSPSDDSKAHDAS